MNHSAEQTLTYESSATTSVSQLAAPANHHDASRSKAATLLMSSTQPPEQVQVHMHTLSSTLLLNANFEQPPQGAGTLNRTNAVQLAPAPFQATSIGGGPTLQDGHEQQLELFPVSLSSASSSIVSYLQNASQPFLQDSLNSTSAFESPAGPELEQTFNEWWNEYWSRQPFPSGYTQSSITLLATLITTIIILIVVGNLLVCIAIFTEKSLKPTQNWFVASLAVSDLLLGALVMPFSLARELMGFWAFGPIWCDIHEATDVLLTTASINTLCLISLDRYWSITQAVKYLKKRTPRRSAFMIAFVWVFSAAVSLPPLFGWKKQSPNVTSSQTITTPSATRNSQYHKFNSDQQRRKFILSEQATSNSRDSSDSSLYEDQTSFNGLLSDKNSNKPESDDAEFREKPDESGSEFFYPDRRYRRRASNSIERISTDTQQLRPSLSDSTRHSKLPSSSARPLSVKSYSNKRQSNRARHRRTEADLLYGPGAQSSKINKSKDPSAMRYYNLLLQDTSNELGNVFEQPANTMLPASSQLPGQMQTTTTTNTIEYPTCQLSDDVGYVLYSALGSFYIPCAVMVFTYIKIFLAARSRARRAINKQSRFHGGGTNTLAAGDKQQKRSANRKTFSGAFSGGGGHSCKPLLGSANLSPAGLGGKTLSAIKQESGSNGERDDLVKIQNTNEGVDGSEGQDHDNRVVVRARDQRNQKDFVVKGRLVVVDRRKSFAIPGATNAPCQEIDNLDDNMQTAARRLNAADESLFGTTSRRAIDPYDLNDDDSKEQDGQQFTVTTSCAKQATASALDGTSSTICASTSNESSMITVMSTSTGDIQATKMRQHQQTEVEDRKCDKTGKTQTAITDANSKAERRGSAGDRKAEALLRAISQAGEVDDELLNEVSGSAESIDIGATSQTKDREGSLSSGVTNIVFNKRKASQNNKNTDAMPSQDDRSSVPIESPKDVAAQSYSTNETCFMTIEEDSDTFDPQTGRTIMLVAGNSKNLASSLEPKSQGIMMTMLPSTCPQSERSQGEHSNTAVPCGNLACVRRQQQVVGPRSGSSYCGSSLTINDDEDDDNSREMGDEDDDECIDDEDDLLTDDCNGYSGSCGLDHYCQGTTSSVCADCRECDVEQSRHQHRHRQSFSSLITNESPRKQDLSRGEPADRQPHHHHLNNTYHHTNRACTMSEAEAQSLTGDDNISLTEYRSTEENSSIMGHDVLDATTEGGLFEKRRSVSALGHKGIHQNELKHKVPTNQRLPQGTTNTSIDEQKKNSIGFRLGRLSGIMPPLGYQSGGLLTLAANEHQQTQAILASQNQPNTTRNLKALRQNFFNKLNQLTAKSASRPESEKRRRAHMSNNSAQSSGSSYDPSGDCATTSNFHQEFTYGETDDYERTQMSGESSQIRDHYASGIDNRSSHTAFRADQEDGKSKRLVSDRNEFTEVTRRGDWRPDSMFKSQKRSNDNNNDRANRDLLNIDDDSMFNAHSTSVISNINSGDHEAKHLRLNHEMGNNHNNKGDMSLAGNNHGKSTGTSVTSPSEIARPMGKAGNKGTTTGPVRPTGRAYLASDNERHKRKLAKARERRATLILGLIMAAFICSWCPFFTFYVIRALCPVCREYVTPRFEAFIFWMGYCNSAINPIIYTIFNRDFRKAFRSILFRCL